MLSYLLSLSLMSLIVLLMSSMNVITARKRSLGQGNIFTPVCHSVQRGSCVVAGEGACVAAGGVCVVVGGCAEEACMVTGGAWLQGACMVVGGVCGCGGGCRGMYGCRGACMVAGVCVWLWGVCVVVGGVCGCGGHA